MKHLLPNAFACLCRRIVPAALLLLLGLCQPAWAVLTVNADGTVTDSTTSLVWDRYSYGRTDPNCATVTELPHTWAQALDAVVDANTNIYNGFDDWRLPNVKELESIAKIDSSGQPAIDTTAFPCTPPGFSWTSTTYALDLSLAWSVDFNDGTPYYFRPKTDTYYVRLVRSGQAFASFDVLAQTITFANPGEQAFGTTPTLHATASSGLAITFMDVTRGVCTITSSGALTFVTKGLCVIVAAQAGNDSYNEAQQVFQQFTVGKATQATLTVTGPASVTYGSTASLTYSGGTGTGAVTFSAASSTGCSVAGTTLSVTNASNACDVTVSKAADSSYSAATSASYRVTLNKASQSAVTLTSTSASPGTPLTLSASGGSGTGAYSYAVNSTGTAGCSISGGGTTLTASTAGSCTVIATRSADSNYNSAASSATSVTISAASTYSVTYNANTSTGGSVPTDGATYANGATVTVLGNTGTLVKTGYAFSGWNTAANGSGAGYVATNTLAIAANTTLYAKWTINTYNLSYSAGANGSLTGAASQTVNYNTSGSAVTAVPATNYHFTNWSDGQTANPRTDSNVVASVTVTANFGTISISAPATVAFGKISLNRPSSPQTITVLNNGSMTLNIGAIALTLGGANYSLKSDTCSSTSLEPAASCTLKAVFTPTGSGALSGTLHIPSNTAALDISLTGEGVAPANPLASVSATALSFGQITVGSASTEQAITVKNTGNANLVIGAVTLTGADFVITNNGCTGITLASATNCIMKTKFTPSAAVARAASISIPSNDPGSPNISVALDGTGIAAPKPAISVTPADISFAKVASSATQTVTVKNKGAAVLNIAALTVGGTDSAKFSLSNNTCSSTAVAVAATCSFDLTFTPGIAGSYSGVLSIPSDDPNTPVLKLSLGGTTAAIAAADVAASGGVTVKDLVLVDGLSGAESYSIDKALSFTATGVSGSASFTLSFGSLPANPDIYKVVGSVWKQLYPVNTCTGASGIVLDTAAKTLTFTLADNSDCDSDPTLGTIKDPIAVVSPATYGVSYNANTSTGGSVPTDGNSYANGATVTVLGNTGTLVKTGYTFNGWNTLANGTGTTQATASTFAMGSAAVTLYAQWTTAAVSGTLITRYRLYHDGTKEHLYTTDANEYSVLATRGWLAEGAIYQLYQGAGSLNGVVAVPFYRLYNRISQQHHWTTDANEYNVLGQGDWTKEGVDGYILPSNAAGSIPVYRLYLNAFGGLHLWTTDLNEKNVLSTRGWVYEGVSGYVVPLQ